MLASMVDRKEMRKRYYDKYTCTPNLDPNRGGPPIFTATIALLCITMFRIVNMQTSQALTTEALKNSSLIFVPKESTQIWRYGTYSLLHLNNVHIVSNMVLLVIIGPLLEVSQGSIRPFIIYVTGVIFGAMLSQQMAPEKYLVGASGAQCSIFRKPRQKLTYSTLGEIQNLGLFDLKSQPNRELRFFYYFSRRF